MSTPPATPFPLSFSEFARRVGRNPSAVSRAVQGPLAGAVLLGGRVDARHPDTIAWAAKRGVTAEALLAPGSSRRRPRDAAQPQQAPTAAAPAPSPAPLAGHTPRDAVPAPQPDADELLDMTLAAITDCYGSLPGFADYVDVRKRLAEIAKLERQNEEAKGLLIERELVRVHVFGLIEGVFRRLLTDSPKTIARLVYAEAKADRPVEDAEKLVRKQVSAQLKTLKAKAGKALNGSVADGESGEPATS